MFVYIYVDIYVHTKRGAREKNNCVRDSDEKCSAKIGDWLFVECAQRRDIANDVQFQRNQSA